ncbi:major tail protein [Staphylococcus pettenkoferi]|uniref:major tail protein n=1 Tax=Staphylococcus pettenkoferi TaxID=170573 RepID=UPI00066BDF8F|nr:major tail protein [Staphylococcus pettenkoferi]MCY1589852.1 phage tail protein [Staphylococcus pettenkoferi]MCY1599242.1 phage tail protein [Staphylococcus pettenkoferi]MCY1613784.1 phage tail protein [Staphylococcus pettenkoferi]PNZ87004.1 phage tail protein [Staphylococcus pettenkoferi]QQC36845.1 phage tail protein [Staphylococcus pettenkoferi]
MAEKSYRSFTGLTEFYYKVHGEDVQAVTDPERIKYLQEISVSKDQDIEKAYGDNQVAEMAVANGTIEVEAGFHKLPLEDRVALFGLEKSEDGIVSVGNDTPPYVAVMFAKTMEDGSREYVGLPKGLFTFPELEGNTKEDGVEFSSDSTTAEFMQAPVKGFEEEKAMLLGHDAKGTSVMKDAIWSAIFDGKAEDDSENTSDDNAEETETP